MALTLRSKDGCAPNDKLTKMFDKLMSFGAARKLTSTTSNTSEYDAYHERETWQKLKTERDKDLVLMFGEDDVRIFYRGKHDEGKRVTLQSVKMEDTMANAMRQAGMTGGVGGTKANRRRGRLEGHLARAQAAKDAAAAAAGGDADGEGGGDGDDKPLDLHDKGEDENGPLDRIEEVQWKKWIRTEREDNNTETQKKAKRRRRHHRRACKFHPFSTNADFRKLSLQTSFPKRVVLDSIDRVQHAANGSVSGYLDESPIDEYFVAPDVVSERTPMTWNTKPPTHQHHPAASEGEHQQHATFTMLEEDGGVLGGGGSQSDQFAHSEHLSAANPTSPLMDTNPPTPNTRRSDDDGDDESPAAAGERRESTSKEEDNRSQEIEHPEVSPIRQNDGAPKMDVKNRRRSLSNISNVSSAAASATNAGSRRLSAVAAHVRRGSGLSSRMSSARTSIVGTSSAATTPNQQAQQHQNLASAGTDSLSRIPQAMSTVFLTEATANMSPLLGPHGGPTMASRCRTPALDQFSHAPKPHTYIAPAKFCDCECTDCSTDDELSSDDERVRPIVGTADRAELKVLLFQRQFALTNIHARSALNSILDERLEERELACRERRHLNIITEEAEKCGADWRVSRRQRSTTPSQGSVWKGVHAAIGDDQKHTAKNRDHYATFVDSCAKIGFPATNDQLRLIQDFRDICLKSSRTQQRVTKVIPATNARPGSRGSAAAGASHHNSNRSRPNSRASTSLGGGLPTSHSRAGSTSSRPASRQTVKQLRGGGGGPAAMARASTPGAGMMRQKSEVVVLGGGGGGGAHRSAPTLTADPTTTTGDSGAGGVGGGHPSIFNAPLGKGNRSTASSPSLGNTVTGGTASAMDMSTTNSNLLHGMMSQHRPASSSSAQRGLQMTSQPLKEDVMLPETFFRLLEIHGHHMVTSKLGVTALDLIRELCGVGTKEFLSAVYAKEHVWPLGTEMHQLHKRLIAARSTFIQRGDGGSNATSAQPSPSFGGGGAGAGSQYHHSSGVSP